MELRSQIKGWSEALTCTPLITRPLLRATESSALTIALQRFEPMTDPANQNPQHERASQPSEANIRELVEVFYQRVDEDPLLGPIFSRELTGRWDTHLAKMTTFWASLVLGTKDYRGNVQEAHRPLGDIEPEHFARWISLFLDTVQTRYEPAAAVQFMEPALRIAQSLQLSKFGWDYRIPDAQLALLASLKRLRRGEREGKREGERKTAAAEDLPDRSGTTPFPVDVAGVDSNQP
jgi:hemoglobin